MKLVVFGINERAEKVLPVLIEKQCDIVMLVTEKRCSSIISIADKYNIPFITPENINNKDIIQQLKNIQADVFFIISYNQILKEDVYTIPAYGTFNCHGGKLPEYRGSSVINWQIINGETSIGLSIIKISNKIDAGDIAVEQSFDITINDDINTILKKSYSLFADMSVKLLEHLKSNTLKLTKQNEIKAGYWAKRTAADGFINWNNLTGTEIHNLVRALTLPYPCAFTYYNGNKINIVKTSVPEIPMHSVPGKLSFKTGTGILVGASGYSGIIIEKIQDETGTVFNAQDYFKTRPDYFISVNMKIK